MDTWVYAVIIIVVIAAVAAGGVWYVRKGVKLGQRHAPRRWKLYVRSERAARIAKARALERAGLKQPSTKMQIDDVNFEIAMKIHDKNQEILNSPRKRRERHG